MPNSMNDPCACTYVSICVDLCVFSLLCLVHACVHGCTCSEFLPLCSCSSTHDAMIAIELPIGLCSTKVEQCMGVLVGLLRLTSFLLRERGETECIDREIGFLFFFPVLMDQRMSLRFCIRFVFLFFFHLYLSERSYKKCSLACHFFYKCRPVVMTMIMPRCAKISCVELQLYMCSGRVISGGGW